MLTRTLPSHTPSIPVTPEFIQSKVDQRWFYLYEWISPDELQMTLERDYLTIVKGASIPLAIITVIAGLIGFSWGVFWTLLAILGVLSVFYLIVALILSLRFLYRTILYTRGANVVITDGSYVSGSHILAKTDREGISRAFSDFEKTFDEQFLGESTLAEKKNEQKKALFENLKDIAFSGGKIMSRLGNSRNSWGIVIVLLLAGILYGAMMGAVYFIGIFFISLFGRLFSWLAHEYLLIMRNTEYRIQNLFLKLDDGAEKLQRANDTSLSLLADATRNEWKENLLGKLNESLTLLSGLAGSSTTDSLKLRKILESSRYKDIFNFTKYGNWVKHEILEPIESILLLLSKNRDTLKKTIDSLETQITQFPSWGVSRSDGVDVSTDPSLQKPLILQKERLEMQYENFERNIRLLESYRERLQ